ncbi:MAG: S-adenosylmethionine:tRNA ribosyltransferase-isomerase [Nitrospinae bacterium]|nr:S-adenosylmethionine:tRNA ribosyltransferase-isomerase [Nitrospinota bacterium]
MRLSDFDYILPKELIAQHPADERDSSRLLVLDRKSGKIEHTIFKNILKYLTPSDVLVLNDTAVFPARLIGRKKKTGGKVEIFLLREISKGRWAIIPNSEFRDPNSVDAVFGDGDMECKVSGNEAIFNFNGNIYDILEKYGQVPLPPYIKRVKGQGSSLPPASSAGQALQACPCMIQAGIVSRGGKDKERYQTVYAEKRGAVAAPTAGLHFTEKLLSDIEKKGVEIAKVTLHVGYGTFKPVKPENIKEHKIDPEYYEIKESEANKINNAVKSGMRIVTVGTTTVRTLESAVSISPLPIGERDGACPRSIYRGVRGVNREITAQCGYTDIFIYNGFDFKITNALLTNFHLPKSSLLMLVCAFAGKDMILNAYNEAIKRGYRFYSYGDAMLII